MAAAVVVTVAVSSPVAASSSEPPVPDLTFAVDEAAMQAWLDGFSARSGVLGAVFGMQRGDQPAVVVASGHADADATVALDPDAPFFIGSVTKTFVAAIVMQLVDEGVLDLDDPASKYVELWPEASAITIRQLLGHRSGLPSVANRDSMAEWAPIIGPDLTRVWTPEEVLAEIAGGPLLFEPGTDYHYSNGNFIVVGLVVEAVTGESLEALIAERLAEPLGLDDTYLHPGTGEVDPRIPHCLFDLQGLEGELAGADDLNNQLANVVVREHFIDACALPLNAFISVLGASASVVSTPLDLLTWLPALYGESDLLSADSRGEMVDDRLGTSGVCPCGSSGSLGLGHAGLFVGFSTQVAYYPEADLSVVLYVNQAPLPSGALEDVIVNALTALSG